MSEHMPTDEQIETLARVYDLDAFRDEVWQDTIGARYRQDERKETALAWATWQTRHPGPLLEALAEAGVLRDRADAWDDGFDAGHQAARAVNPEWPGVPSNPYRPGAEEPTDARP